MYDTSVPSTVFKLRKMLDDLIDCLILSSAIDKADALVTEDKDAQKAFLKGNDALKV